MKKLILKIITITLRARSILSFVMMASKKFRVAIAGAGMVTRHHLNAWAKLPQVEVAAICARHLKNAQDRATQFGIPKAYDNAAAMLDAEKPDALDIATPPDVHAEQVKLAAECGAYGTVSGNFCAAGFPLLPTDRLELIGEKASIIFDKNDLVLFGDEQEKISYDLNEVYQTSYNNAIAHFIKSLESGEPFETDRLDNLETLRLVTDAYRLAGR